MCDPCKTKGMASKLRVFDLVAVRVKVSDSRQSWTCLGKECQEHESSGKLHLLPLLPDYTLF